MYKCPNKHNVSTYYGWIRKYPHCLQLSRQGGNGEEWKIVVLYSEIPKFRLNNYLKARLLS